MIDADFGALVVRMVVSLVIVLGIIGGAYVVIRRRHGYGSRLRTPARADLLAALTGRRRPGEPQRRPAAGPRVIGRVALGRTTQLVVVQLADHVFVIVAPEQGAPTLLAQMPADEWVERAGGRP